ncbi:MAG: hypothetical protein ACNS62_18425 [Candidatus Cyclobacteriaceae bacterium M3_2C_046]
MIQSKNFFLILLSANIFILGLSCEPEQEKVIDNPAFDLRFSRDSVIFDTLFSTVGSVTKRFRVFNPSENAIVIDQIKLGEPASPYQLILNGEEGKIFEDQFILGRDSLLVLVKVKIDPAQEDLPFLVKDSVVFRFNEKVQDVKLVAWGQDAFFLPKSILNCDTTWTSQKPIVLMDSVLVDENCSLTIDPGTKIFCDINASLLVAGSLNVNGTAEQPVIFTNSRLDIIDAFAQWKGIFFASTSKNNQIKHAEIRNAINGIYLGIPDQDTIPDLVLSHTIIENMANAGILSFTSDLLVYNVLINNCVNYCVANLAGGNYTYFHCTLANYSFDFFRETPLLAVSNHLNRELIEPLQVEMYNSIVWGDLDNEILISQVNGAPVTLSLGYNLFKTDLQNLDINQNILNESPRFIDPENYGYQLDTLSPAQDQGLIIEGISQDLTGQARDSLPDLGAYER